MYRDSLPTECKPVPLGKNRRRLALSVALSVFAHGLLLWLFLTRPEKIPSLPAGKAGQSIEVTLTSLPAPKPQPVPTPPPPPLPAPQAEPAPVPAIRPAPKPPEIHRPKPRPPKPVPKPRKPAPAPVPHEEPPEPVPREEPPPKPSQESRRPPKPMAADEAMPEFKDDFQQLATDYSRNGQTPAAGQAQADNTVHPGAILNINPKIYYPREAMRKGMQGVVVVLIHISVDGHTDGVDLVQSSGYEELDNQVLGAVQHWRFVPPRRGNTPVEGTYKHTVIFGPDEEVINDFATHWREIKLQPAQ